MKKSPSVNHLHPIWLFTFTQSGCSPSLLSSLIFSHCSLSSRNEYSANTISSIRFGTLLSNFLLSTTLSCTRQHNAVHSPRRLTCQLGHLKDRNGSMEILSWVGGVNSCVSSKSSGVVRIELRHCLIGYTKAGGTLEIEHTWRKLPTSSHGMPW